jgi:hypothetical protein
MLAPARQQPVWRYHKPSCCQSAQDFTQPFYTQDSPLYERWRRLSQHEYTTDLRPTEWRPVDYPSGIFQDPTYYMRYPYWGSNYLYYRPFYQSPTGACVQDTHCIDGVAASGCMNFDNSKAHAFYSGKSCRDLERILGPNFVQPAQPSGTSCRAQPQGCNDWN